MNQAAMDNNLPYVIRDVASPAEGLRLELFVEGTPIATATASADVLADMAMALGLQREDIAAELRKALEDFLKHQLDKVIISEPVEDPQDPLRFRARYTYRDTNDISTGLVWYDVNTSDTGPEELPAVIRNKMRLEVHRKLTRTGGAARALVDLHK